VLDFFQDKSLRTICPGWFQTMILLISVFWVARTIWIALFDRV
jgi:hypothetical protein